MTFVSRLLIFLLTINILSVFSAETVQVSEESLAALASRGSPQLDQIEAAFLSASVKEGETTLKFAPELFGRTLYSETNERAIIQFQPIFSPVKQAQLGVRKNFAQGLETSAYVITDQRSAQGPFIGRLNNVTTTTLAFTAQLDLWKNLFGKLSRRELESAQYEKQRAEIEKEIQSKTFRISLRRLYWSLVANRESTLISQGLLKTAQQQLDEAKLRLRNSVAEPDEVARYEAQLASRKGTHLYLDYQREALLKQLRNLLPELAGKEIELAGYDLQKTLTEVLACAGAIGGEPSVPYGHTRYDEAVALLRQIRANNGVINARYADADVKLFGTVKSTGVGSDAVRAGLVRGSYGSSIDDQTEQNRTGYEVGINFTLPLGGAKESTGQVKELYDDKRLQAQIAGTDTQVVTTHQQLTKSIALLSEVIKSQRTSSEQLAKRLLLVRRKYQQARATVDQLVLDQDALLSSELTTIESQLAILNTLFDYLVIFTETPCSFNRN
jgi:outer membrane protein TolC